MTANDNSGPDDLDEPFDPNAATDVARNALADELGHVEWQDGGAVDDLVGTANLLARTLRQGKAPDEKDIEEARMHLQHVEETLNSLTRLCGYRLWDTGVAYGDLPEDEQRHVDAARCDR